MSRFVYGRSTIRAEVVGLSQLVPTVSTVPVSHGSSVPVVMYDATKRDFVHLKKVTFTWKSARTWTPTSGGIQTPRPFDTYQECPHLSSWEILDACAPHAIERILIFLFAPFAIDSDLRVCHHACARIFHVVKISISEACTYPAYEGQN
jgi:hypothetical protein